ncbi:TonB-dependent receptor, partial [Steroidobacter sp.]|uniref:TonB-dependent receptor n=1 Tax=Steroidobacter sp. TaxID=1978227 RepID=UPI001A512B94
MIHVLRAIRNVLLTHSMRSSASAILLATMAVPSVVVAADSRASAEFTIPASSLEDALSKFGTQSGMQVAYGPELARGLKAPAINGRFTFDAALDKLLQGTGLTWSYVNATTVVLKRAATSNSKSTQRVDAPDQVAEEVVVKGIPEVMVVGKKSLNVDIERTQDDPQPYVVFNRESIERSGATSLNDFLMARLPMNSSATPAVATDINNGNTSSISLRGLGQGQTLVLIDGRRAASTTNGFSSGQTDINGIPLAAIERIEVLPTTASAIYGGSATGGVINIIMRRDYVGTQAAVTYDSSFDGDSAVKRYDLSSGFTLFDGRTSVLLNGSYTESDTLLNRQREFSRRGRERLLANSPGYNLPLGSGINVRSASGDNLVLDDGTELNSGITYAPESFRGIGLDGDASLRSNAGNYDLGLASGAERNSRGVTGSDAVIAGAGAPVKYFGGSVRHEFSDRVKAFLEISHSENRSRWGGRGVNLPGSISADAPSNPFDQDIDVAWSTQQLAGYIEAESGYDRYATGVIVNLPGQWVASLDYTLSESEWSYRNTTPSFGNNAAFYSAVNAGAIDVLRGFDEQGIDVRQFLANDFTLIQSPLEVTTKNPALRLSGPVGSLPAGRPQVSLLLERQDSDFSTSTQRFGNGFVRLFPERSRTIDSAYLELRLPLLSPSNKLAWMEEAELQLAGRWDSYESTNAAPSLYRPPGTPEGFTFIRHQTEEVSPLIALRLQPSRDVAFRASYGEGFLPPDIGQLTASTVIPGDTGLSWLNDPRRGNEPITGMVDYSYGGNPDLKSETSTSWSAGFVFTPRWVDGLRLSVDYTEIKKKNNIVALDDQTLLDNETFFPGRVTRGANLPGDPAGWAG